MSKLNCDSRTSCFFWYEKIPTYWSLLTFSRSLKKEKISTSLFQVFLDFLTRLLSAIWNNFVKINLFLETFNLLFLGPEGEKWTFLYVLARAFSPINSFMMWKCHVCKNPDKQQLLLFVLRCMWSIFWAELHPKL